MRRIGLAIAIAGFACMLSLGAVAYAADGGLKTSSTGTNRHVTVQIGTDAPFTLGKGAPIPNIKGNRTVETDGDLIQAALNEANVAGNADKVVVTLEAGKTYSIAGKLRIYSHTVLDLNGATIKRSSGTVGAADNDEEAKLGVDDGIIYNYPVGWQGTTGVQRADVGGYDMSSDITVKNGKLDGGKLADATGAADLLRIDHASDITITKVDFDGVYDCHHLEFVGVKNGLVSDCAFTGFRFQKGHEKDPEYGREAIELDGAWQGNVVWAKNSKLDGTHNESCVIERCTFTDVPSAAGSHHFSMGPKDGYQNARDCVIRDCVITAPAEKTYYKTAITAGGIDGLSVTGNKVTGPYNFSIHAYQGDRIDISGNTFADGRMNSVMVDGNAKNVTLTGNVVSNAAKHAISILDCEVTSVSDNKVSGAKGNGISVTNSTVGVVENNEITGVKSNGISLVSGTITSGILNNVVKSKTNAIVVSKNKGDQGVTPLVQGNSVEQAGKNGISIVGGAVTKGILDNTIVSGVNAIVVTGGKAGAIQDNTVKQSGNNSISIVGGKVTKGIGSNTVKSGANAIVVTGGKVAGITKNKIQKAAKNGISIVGGAVTKGIQGNTVKKAKGHGITITKGTVSGIANNTVTNPKLNGISVSGKAKVGSINGNTIVKNAGKFGMWLGSSQVTTVVKNNEITVDTKKYGIGIGPGVKVKQSGNKVTVK